MQGDNVGICSVVGDFTLNQASNETITICHKDTSTLSGCYGSNGISSITVDGLGHVTGVTTATYCTTSGVTINNNTNDYVLTATGTANTINGEVNLTFNGTVLCVKGTGGVCVTNCVTADNFITTSDIRLKCDIQPLKDSIEILKKFNSYSYTKNGYIDAGFIAQEVCEAIPYTVKENEEGYLTMRDRPILAYLHSAIIELNSKLECIENKLK